MPRADALGNLIGTVGSHPLALWPIELDAAFACPFIGGRAGWLEPGTALAAGPELFTVSAATAWAKHAFDPFEPNDLFAGGDWEWIASRATENNLHGTEPPGNENWKAHDRGNDGTRILILNGVYQIFWGDGGDESYMTGVSEVRAGSAGIAVRLGDRFGQLRIVTRDGETVPAQLTGEKGAAITIAPGWLMYHLYRAGLVIHTFTDATRGYLIPGDFFQDPGAVSLADLRTMLFWSAGADETAPYLRRTFVILGDGMTPLPVDPPVIEPPIEPQPPEPPIEPEPPTPGEPMPPSNPLKPGKTPEQYWGALAHTISDDGPNKLMTFESAVQGIRQTWDQLNAALDWMNGNACVRGACSRSGQSSVIVDPLLWDRVSPIVRAIDLEFLQRG